MKVTLLSEAEIRDCVGFDREALEAIAQGFSRLAEGRAFAPPVIAIEIPEHNGEVDIKTAYIEGLDSFAVKVAAGFFDNPARGLPYGTGMMVLISAETGFLQALLVDNGYLTELRTGLAGALAADSAGAPRDRDRRRDRLGLAGALPDARPQDGARLQAPVRLRGHPRGALALRRRHGGRARRRGRRGGHGRVGRARKRRRGLHHAGARALPAGPMAAPRPARHLDGLRHAGQAGALRRVSSPGPTASSAIACRSAW